MNDVLQNEYRFQYTDHCYYDHKLQSYSHYHRNYDSKTFIVQATRWKGLPGTNTLTYYEHS